MLHAYCIRHGRDPYPAPDVVGLHGAPVVVVRNAELAMWISSAGHTTPTLERLREHDRVVRAALGTATPLPLRFGTRFASEAEVRAALASRGDEFLALLSRLSGSVEMGVRVRRPPSPQQRPEISSGRGGSSSGARIVAEGRGYLEEKKKLRMAATSASREAEEITARLEKQLGDLPFPSVATISKGDEPEVSMAHLVPGDRIAGYRARMQRVQVENPDLDIVVTGPWAPYSFVRGE